MKRRRHRAPTTAKGDVEGNGAASLSSRVRRGTARLLSRGEAKIRIHKNVVDKAENGSSEGASTAAGTSRQSDGVAQQRTVAPAPPDAAEGADDASDDAWKSLASPVASARSHPEMPSHFPRTAAAAGGSPTSPPTRTVQRLVSEVSSFYTARLGPTQTASRSSTQGSYQKPFVSPPLRRPSREDDPSHADGHAHNPVLYSSHTRTPIGTARPMGSDLTVEVRGVSPRRRLVPAGVCVGAGGQVESLAEVVEKRRQFQLAEEARLAREKGIERLSRSVERSAAAIRDQFLQEAGARRAKLQILHDRSASTRAQAAFFCDRLPDHPAPPRVLQRSQDYHADLLLLSEQCSQLDASVEDLLQAPTDPKAPADLHERRLRDVFTETTRCGENLHHLAEQFAGIQVLLEQLRTLGEASHSPSARPRAAQRKALEECPANGALHPAGAPQKRLSPVPPDRHGAPAAHPVDAFPNDLDILRGILESSPDRLSLSREALPAGYTGGPVGTPMHHHLVDALSSPGTAQPMREVDRGLSCSLSPASKSRFDSQAPWNQIPDDAFSLPLDRRRSFSQRAASPHSGCPRAARRRSSSSPQAARVSPYEGGSPHAFAATPQRHPPAAEYPATHAVPSLPARPRWLSPIHATPEAPHCPFTELHHSTTEAATPPSAFYQTQTQPSPSCWGVSPRHDAGPPTEARPLRWVPQDLRKSGAECEPDEASPPNSAANDAYHWNLVARIKSPPPAAVRDWAAEVLAQRRPTGEPDAAVFRAGLLRAHEQQQLLLDGLLRRLANRHPVDNLTAKSTARLVAAHGDEIAAVFRCLCTWVSAVDPQFSADAGEDPDELPSSDEVRNLRRQLRSARDAAAAEAERASSLAAELAVARRPAELPPPAKPARAASASASSYSSRGSSSSPAAWLGTRAKPDGAGVRRRLSNALARIAELEADAVGKARAAADADARRKAQLAKLRSRLAAAEAAGPDPLAGDAAAARVAKLEQELADAKAEKKQLAAEARALRAEAFAVKRDKVAAVAEEGRKLTAAELQATEGERECAVLKTEVDDLHEEIAALRDELRAGTAAREQEGVEFERLKSENGLLSSRADRLARDLEKAKGDARADRTARDRREAAELQREVSALKEARSKDAFAKERELSKAALDAERSRSEAAAVQARCDVLTRELESTRAELREAQGAKFRDGSVRDEVADLRKTISSLREAQANDGERSKGDASAIQARCDVLSRELEYTRAELREAREAKLRDGLVRDEVADLRKTISSLRDARAEDDARALGVAERLRAENGAVAARCDTLAAELAAWRDRTAAGPDGAHPAADGAASRELEENCALWRGRCGELEDMLHQYNAEVETLRAQSAQFAQASENDAAQRQARRAEAEANRALVDKLNEELAERSRLSHALGEEVESLRSELLSAHDLIRRLRPDDEDASDVRDSAQAPVASDLADAAHQRQLGLEGEVEELLTRDRARREAQALLPAAGAAEAPPPEMEGLRLEVQALRHENKRLAHALLLPQGRPAAPPRNERTESPWSAGEEATQLEREREVEESNVSHQAASAGWGLKGEEAEEGGASTVAAIRGKLHELEVKVRAEGGADGGAAQWSERCAQLQGLLAEAARKMEWFEFELSATRVARERETAALQAKLTEAQGRIESLLHTHADDIRATLTTSFENELQKSQEAHSVRLDQLQVHFDSLPSKSELVTVGEVKSSLNDFMSQDSSRLLRRIFEEELKKTEQINEQRLASLQKQVATVEMLLKKGVRPLKSLRMQVQKSQQPPASPSEAPPAAHATLEVKEDPRGPAESEVFALRARTKELVDEQRDVVRGLEDRVWELRRLKDRFDEEIERCGRVSGRRRSGGDEVAEIRDELARVRKAHSRDMADMSRQTEERIESLLRERSPDLIADRPQQMNVEQPEYTRSEVEQLLLDQANELAKVDDQSANAIEHLQAEVTRLQHSEADARQELGDIREQHLKEIEEIKQQYSRMVHQLQRDIGNLRSLSREQTASPSKAVSELVERHHEEVAQLKNQHQRALRQADAALRAKVADRAAAAAELERENRAKLEDMLEQRERAVALLKEENNRLAAKAKKLSRRRASAEPARPDDADGWKSGYEARLGELNGLYSKELDSVSQRDKAYFEKIHQEIDRLREAVATKEQAGGGSDPAMMNWPSILAGHAEEVSELKRQHANDLKRARERELGVVARHMKEIASWEEAVRSLEDKDAAGARRGTSPPVERDDLLAEIQTQKQILLETEASRDEALQELGVWKARHDDVVRDMRDTHRVEVASFERQLSAVTLRLDTPQALSNLVTQAEITMHAEMLNAINDTLQILAKEAADRSVALQANFNELLRKQQAKNATTTAALKEEVEEARRQAELIAERYEAELYPLREELAGLHGRRRGKPPKDSGAVIERLKSAHAQEMSALHLKLVARDSPERPTPPADDTVQPSAALDSGDQLAQYSALTSEVAHLSDEVDHLRNALTAKEKEAEAHRAKAKERSERLASLAAENDEKQRAVDELTEALAAKEEQLDRLRHAGEDSAEVAGLADDMSKLEATVQLLRHALTSKEDQLLELKEREREVKEALADMQTEHQSVVDHYETNLEQLQQALDAEHAECTALRQEMIDHIRQQEAERVKKSRSSPSEHGSPPQAEYDELKSSHTKHLGQLHGSMADTSRALGAAEKQIKALRRINSGRPGQAELDNLEAAHRAIQASLEHRIDELEKLSQQAGRKSQQEQQQPPGSKEAAPTAAELRLRKEVSRLERALAEARGPKDLDAEIDSLYRPQNEYPLASAEPSPATTADEAPPALTRAVARVAEVEAELAERTASAATEAAGLRAEIGALQAKQADLVAELDAARDEMQEMASRCRAFITEVQEARGLSGSRGLDELTGFELVLALADEIRALIEGSQEATREAASKKHRREVEKLRAEHKDEVEGLRGLLEEAQKEVDRAMRSRDVSDLPYPFPSDAGSDVQNPVPPGRAWTPHHRLVPPIEVSDADSPGSLGVPAVRLQRPIEKQDSSSSLSKPPLPSSRPPYIYISAGGRPVKTVESRSSSTSSSQAVTEAKPKLHVDRRGRPSPSSSRSPDLTASPRVSRSASPMESMTESQTWVRQEGNVFIYAPRADEGGSASSRNSRPASLSSASGALDRPFGSDVDNALGQRESVVHVPTALSQRRLLGHQAQDPLSRARMRRQSSLLATLSPSEVR
eukprot:gene4874-7521_t